MSRAHRAASRRAARAGRVGEPGHIHEPSDAEHAAWLGLSSDFATQAGWCADAEEIPEVRRRTHDLLIGGLGDRRRGGVRWFQFSGDVALRVIGEYAEDAPSAEHAEVYEELRRLLTAEGGFLVIACAPGVR